MKNKTIIEMLLNGIGTVAYMSGWIVGKVLWKLKRQIWTLALIMIAIYLPLYFFTPVAFAPKAQAIYFEHPQTEREQIINYITDVFGKDAPQALMIARCESGLRPNALNDNTTWGGVSQDLGLFQINKQYQGVTNPSFLYDWKINTLMAKQIFDNRGNWGAWTCSRTLGL
jgi:hypothetical protein